MTIHNPLRFTISQFREFLTLADPERDPRLGTAATQPC